MHRAQSRQIISPAPQLQHSILRSLRTLTGRVRHLTLRGLSWRLHLQDMGNGKALQNGGGSTGSQEGYGMPVDPKKRRISGISSVQDTKPLLAQSDSSIDRSLAAPEEHTVSRSVPGCLHLRCMPAAAAGL